MISRLCVCALPVAVLKAFLGGVLEAFGLTGDDESCDIPRGSGDESIPTLTEDIGVDPTIVEYVSSSKIVVVVTGSEQGHRHD